MIELFKPGTSHIVNGVTCIKQTVSHIKWQHYLDEGWFLTSEECYPDEAQAILDNNGLLIRLESGQTEDKHSTETALDDFDFHVILEASFANLKYLMDEISLQA